jgi:hypothetical protein
MNTYKEIKEILKEINTIQLNTFQTYQAFAKSFNLETKQRGLYWIWTNLTDEELANAKWKTDSKHINILDLIKKRKGLTHVCQVQHQGYRIIYNGIGGYTKLTKNCSGLRERLLQEFNTTSTGTGTLSIVSTSLKLEHFAISFFNFDDKENIKNFKFLKENDAYLIYASELEKLWRLEFGQPILCRL